MKKALYLLIFILPFIVHNPSFCQTWQQYDSLRLIYYDKQSYDTSLVFAEKALQAMKDQKGESDTLKLYANILTHTARANYYSGKYATAIEFGEQDKKLRKIIQGEKHHSYLYTIDYLAESYTKTGKYQTAESLYIEVKNIKKEVLGEKTSSYANTLNSLAVLYYKMGNIKAAEPLYLESNKIYKEVLGEKHPDYAISLNNLSAYYFVTGNYSAAESLLLESKNIKEEVIGKIDISYAQCIENLAQLYNTIGNFPAAELLLLEAKKIRKALQGEKHSDYALTLQRIGNLYFEMGKYSIAEPLYFEVKDTYKEVFGDKHPDYASILFDFAKLYIVMGNYSSAEALLLEAIKIDKEILGEKNSAYAAMLNGLALLYKKTGNYSAAELLFIESKSILKEVVGEKHIDYAQSLNNLAELYRVMGNYTVAEPLYIEANCICKEVVGEKSRTYAIFLNNLGVLYKAMGDYTAAEPLYLEATNIIKFVLGDKHPNYASSLSNLAVFYEAMGNDPTAETLYQECLKIIYDNIKQNFAFLSEKENYFKTLSGNFNAFSAFAFKRYKENSLIAQNLYNLTLATKGLMLNSRNRIRDEINNSSDTALVNQYKNWQTLKEDIGRYSQWSKAKLKKMNVKLDSLENIANNMEKQISLKSDVFSNDRKNNEITWNLLQQKLNDKEAAIEFITYKTTNSKDDTKKPDTTYYCALIISKEDKYPQMITLCTNMELSALIEKTELYQTTAQVKGTKPVVNTYVDNETESQVLYKLLWKPLDSLLAGKEKIYVSLSGLLNKISFNTLQDDKKQLLLNKYNLCFVNSTRQLAMEELVKAETNQTIALFGGINYEVDTTQIKLNASKKNNNSNDIYALRALSSDTLRGNSWTYLQGTLSEVNNINKVFLKKKWNTKVYTGNDGTEEAFKSLSGRNSPSILHISTHGFFFPEPDSTTYKTTRNQFKTMLNPLWRSGILLAGANYAWQCNPAILGAEDGVLTAYEVANSNLKNTDLVVLSACETGLGDIKTGEGVYGLQRAFQVAGAKAVIMSLWQVPDKETTELMTLFYESYIKTKNKHDSFRKAQQTMSKKYDPYYWAAFVLME